MSGAVLAVGAFALLFVLAGYLKLRIECSGDGNCSHCGSRSCTLKKNER
jgi:hypothetical protein